MREYHRFLLQTSVKDAIPRLDGLKPHHLKASRAPQTIARAGRALRPLSEQKNNLRNRIIAKLREWLSIGLRPPVPGCKAGTGGEAALPFRSLWYSPLTYRPYLHEKGEK